MAIGHRSCADLSHADAMTLIDTQSATLSLKVKRSEKARLPTPHLRLQLLTGGVCLQGSSRVPLLASASPRGSFNLPLCRHRLALRQRGLLRRDRQ